MTSAVQTTAALSSSPLLSNELFSAGKAGQFQNGTMALSSSARGKLHMLTGRFSTCSSSPSTKYAKPSNEQYLSHAAMRNNGQIGGQPSWKTLAGMLWADTNSSSLYKQELKSGAGRREDTFAERSRRQTGRGSSCLATLAPPTATWQVSPATMVFDAQPIPFFSPIFQPTSIVQPQFPNPEVRPSLFPGVSEPSSAPEFSPFPNQPGTSPTIEVPTIAPGITEVPNTTPSELPPSGTPTEVPSFTPPSFTPPDLPTREVDFPTRAPPIPIPNTPPITPPGTPEPTPTPETVPIPPPGKPDPTPPPQAPPLTPPGQPPAPPELPPSSPPEFPGFPPPPEVPPPGTPPLSPPTTPEFPPITPGPEIMPPGFGGGELQALYRDPSRAPRSASWQAGHVSGNGELAVRTL